MFSSTHSCVDNFKLARGKLSPMFFCTCHCPRCQSVDAVLTMKLVVAQRNGGPDCGVKTSRPRRTNANHFLLDLSSVV